MGLHLEMPSIPGCKKRKGGREREEGRKGKKRRGGGLVGQSKGLGLRLS